MWLALSLHPKAVVTGRPRTPVATYRVQFNQQFTFRDARGIVDYLHALGVSDCYASSYLKAVPGSPHGYDVVDPTRLNPEIGTDEEYWEWIDALKAHGMGHILDLVPNHMGIAKSANPWWQDVLENGASSRFARFFDIDWHPVKDELANKVLIPILGDQYGAILERQELRLEYQDGSFALRYYDETLPVAPDTFPLILEPELGPWIGARHGQADADELQSILTACRHLPSRTSTDPESIANRSREKEIVKRRLAVLAERSSDVRALIDTSVRQLNGVAGDPHSFDLLEALLDAQSYRLAHWRVASEEINYRRFFDVNQLAALRVEDPLVFDEVHRFVFELVQRGAATGLRVDHVDGLYDPADYLRRLQERAAESLGSSDPQPLFVVVEKILGPGERLPEWPVDGTTGYEFAAIVNRLFVDGRNERALSDIWLRFVRDRREPPTFAELAYRSKKLVLHETMSGDINSLGHQLSQFAEQNRHFRDFTLYSLISTLKEVIACFPVYRTYVTERDAVAPSDRHYIVEAVRQARSRMPAVTSVVFDFIERLLIKQTMVSDRPECEARARFIGKFQQITGPVAAKGIEDTALYLYPRLLSLNEVGSDPTEFGLDPGAVHAWMAERQRRWPTALSVLSTHDSKRGEDVRARLNVLSEIPGAWKTEVMKWRTVNRRHKTEIRGVLAPDPAEEYLIYQTLIGAWPFDASAEAEREFRRRLNGYIRKALRESKVHTDWLSPDEAYEACVFRFVDSILDRRRANAFLHAFLPFQARVAELAIYNSLSQLLIKITAPGVPDFYQGTELWDLNLVDPDNRRPVDYELRERLFDEIRGSSGCEAEMAAALLEHRNDGQVKLYAASRALCTRARLRDLYEQGDYVPIAASGAKRDCVFAFARRLAGRFTITCVPRMVASLLAVRGTPPLGSDVWGDTRIELGTLGPDASGATYRNAFTGETITPVEIDGRVVLPAAAVFDKFPIALLTL